ncbi:fungal specific transcription factor [Phlyctema vagabunda]|uniref:Fungal specific transcription factor n=1 Tax=Phlyctema vagabunda TaxID=108571 RepID=A0ABR4PCV7_9HELO
MDSSAGRPMQRACAFCRRRKLRCDRLLPRCQSCIRLGQECNYIGQKSTKHRPRAEPTHVEELEERLRRVEGLLRATRERPEEDKRSPSVPSGDEDDTINESRAIAVPPDPETIRDLEMSYFEAIYPIMPIIHYERYTSCQTLSVGPWPPTYLRYAIWAVAAIGANPSLNTHHGEDCYAKARTLSEAAALTPSESAPYSLCRAQAWLHLAMYDMICGRFALSWTSTSQAIRLLQIARVHNIDAVDDVSNNSAFKIGRWSESEERRRAFWFAFCLDRSAFIGQGLPVLINERDIQVNLPAPDRSFQSSVEQATITLSQAFSGSVDPLSSLSAAAVVYSLCSTRLKELQTLDEASVNKLFTNSDWVERDSFCRSVAPVFRVPSYLAVANDNLDANLLYLNIITHCATIQVQRSAQRVAQTSVLPLAAVFIQESTSHCLRAASAIYDLARLASESAIRNYHPATFFCVYDALVIFAECFTAKRDVKLSMSIAFLINFTREQRGHSPLTRNLFRDFENDYPALIAEFSLESRNAFATVLSDGNTIAFKTALTTKQANAQEPKLAMPQQGVPAQARVVNGPLNGTPVYDDAEDWSSCVTESIACDKQDVLSWNSQVIDVAYSSLFGGLSDYEFNSQLFVLPK